VFVGSVDERSDLFQSYVADKDVADKPIKEVMGKLSNRKTRNNY
jgi:cystathionine beta-synthase